MKRSILIAASAALCALSIVASATTAEAKRVRAPAFDPGCNITMPCIGVPAPSYASSGLNASGQIVARNKREERLAARGKRMQERSPIGVARYVSGGGSIVSIARSQIGNGPIYGRGNLWCARFVNHVLRQAGYHGTGSDMASSFASLPRLSGPQVGAIAVYHRGRRGGHVGIVSGFDASGNPIVISGNNGNRVREGAYAKRAYAYVMPQ